MITWSTRSGWLRLFCRLLNLKGAVDLLSVNASCQGITKDELSLTSNAFGRIELSSVRSRVSVVACCWGFNFGGDLELSSTRCSCSSQCCPLISLFLSCSRILIQEWTAFFDQIKFLKCSTHSIKICFALKDSLIDFLMTYFGPLRIAFIVINFGCSFET